MEPVARRFVACATTGLRYRVLSIVAPLGLCAVLAARLLPATASGNLSVFLYFASLAGFMGALLYDSQPRKVILDVERDRLVVDEGRGGVFPLAGAALGRWRKPDWGIVQGTVLQLTNGSGRFRIGGLGHRVRPGVRVALPAEEAYDVYVTAAGLKGLGMFGIGSGDVGQSGSFQALLDLVPIPVDHAPAPEVLRCEAFGPMRSAGNLPAGEIYLGPRELSLVERGGRVPWTVPLAALTVVRGSYTYRARRFRVTHAVLQFWVGGRCALAIGVDDGRIGWHDPTSVPSGPWYFVSTQDWEGIVARLGLGKWMRAPPPD
jgi:hypothetical protein